MLQLFAIKMSKVIMLVMGLLLEASMPIVLLWIYILKDYPNKLKVLLFQTRMVNVQLPWPAKLYFKVVIQRYSE